MRCAVIGGTGYVGVRLVARLLDGGHEVAALVRSPHKLAATGWADRVDVVPGDLADPSAIAALVAGADVVVYLAHALDQPDFPEKDRDAARAVDAAAADAGVRRVVYLGGLRPSGPSSRHLTSRAEVADVFLAGPVPTAALEASIVVGSGSASFEMIRYLAERVPVLPGRAVAGAPHPADRDRRRPALPRRRPRPAARGEPPVRRRRPRRPELPRAHPPLPAPRRAAPERRGPAPRAGAARRARAGRLGGGGAHPALAAARHPADRVAVPGARVRRGGRAHGDRAAARRAHDLRRRGAGGAGAPARRRPRRARPRRRPGARGPDRPGGLRGSGVPLEHHRAVRGGRGRPVGGGRRDRGRRRLVRPARRVDGARLDRPAARRRRGLPGTPARTPAAGRRRRRRLVRRGRRAGLVAPPALGAAPARADVARARRRPRRLRPRLAPAPGGALRRLGPARRALRPRDPGGRPRDLRRHGPGHRCGTPRERCSRL